MRVDWDPLALEDWRRLPFDEARAVAAAIEAWAKTGEGLVVTMAGSVIGIVGAIVQCPLLGFPTSAAKQASESNAGRHSQLIDPPLVTRAAVRMSPIKA
jgi:hypothetical protein